MRTDLLRSGLRAAENDEGDPMAAFVVSCLGQ
jgi:hypothetical protein